ncbi:hypothetical protein AB0K68_29610 [Streptomyces sp. NPDC050698]
MDSPALPVGRAVPPAGRRDVHGGQGALGETVQPHPGLVRAQRAGREEQGGRGVPGVQQEQRPGPVAVVGDRAPSGDGEFGGHAGRCALGWPAQTVNVVAHRVVAVAAGR